MRLRANRYDPALMFGMTGEAVLCCEALVKRQRVGPGLAVSPANVGDGVAGHTLLCDCTLERGVAGDALIIQFGVRLGQLSWTDHRIWLEINQR